MNDFHKELSDLFNLFHDCKILEVIYNKPILLFRIQLPWGQHPSDPEFEILVELSGCHQLTCTYYELIKNPFNPDKSVFEYETIERTTQNAEIISELGLSIQTFEFHALDTYIFICNGLPQTGGGNIEFIADRYRLFDYQGKEIYLQQVINWFEDFWKDDEIKD